MGFRRGGFMRRRAKQLTRQPQERPSRLGHGLQRRSGERVGERRERRSRVEREPAGVAAADVTAGDDRRGRRGALPHELRGRKASDLPGAVSEPEAALLVERDPLGQRGDVVVS